MSYSFYKIIHLGSIFALGLLLGALWGLYLKTPPDKKLKAFLLAGQGLFLFFIFVAGFGLIVKTKLAFPWPFWIYGKLGLWFLLGISPFLIKKASQKLSPRKYFLVLPILFLFFFLALLLVTLK